MFLDYLIIIIQNNSPISRNYATKTRGRRTYVVAIMIV